MKLYSIPVEGIHSLLMYKDDLLKARVAIKSDKFFGNINLMRTFEAKISFDKFPIIIGTNIFDNLNAFLKIIQRIIFL